MIISHLKLVVNESTIMNTDFKKNRYSIYNLTYHLVVITKYRRKCINWKPVFWSNSYFILSTDGATIETIKRYIESQGAEN